MVTLKDVSRKAGVSVSAVSYIINKGPYVSDQTRAKVLDAIRELNYVPNGNARALRRKQTSLKEAIGVLAGPAIFSDPPGSWLSRILAGIEQEVSAANFELLLGRVRIEGRTFDFPRMLRDKRIDGILLVTMHYQEMPDLLDKVKKFGLPIMLVECLDESLALPSITVDNQKAALDAVTHLLDEGYPAVATITGPAFDASARERLRGYKLALMERNRPVKNEHIIEGDFREGSGYEGTKHLLRVLKPPFGIFAANDYMARGAITFLLENHVKVPEEVGVIGFDDITDIVTATKPPISSVHVPWETIGVTAVRQLMLLLEPGKAPSAIPRMLMPCKLRIRASSLRARPLTH